MRFQTSPTNGSTKTVMDMGTTLLDLNPMRARALPEIRQLTDTDALILTETACPMKVTLSHSTLHEAKTLMETDLMTLKTIALRSLETQPSIVSDASTRTVTVIPTQRLPAETSVSTALLTVLTQCHCMPANGTIRTVTDTVTTQTVSKQIHAPQ
jgi:hypothetical protein